MKTLLDKLQLTFSEDMEDGPLSTVADFAFTSTDGLIIKRGEETTLIAAFEPINGNVLVVDEIVVTKNKVTAKSGDKFKFVVNI